MKPPQPKRLAEALARTIGYAPRVSIMPAKFYIMAKVSYLFLSEPWKRT